MDDVNSPTSEPALPMPEDNPVQRRLPAPTATAIQEVEPTTPDTNSAAVEVQKEPRRNTKEADGARQPNQNDILDRIKTGERWMIFFTAIVALTTVAQVTQSACNNAATSKQTDKIIRADERLAGAMEGNITQTIAQSKQSLDATIAQSRLEQRAWLHTIVTNVPAGLPPANTHFLVRIVYENSGRTPLTNLSVAGDIKFAEFETSFKLTDEQARHRLYLGPMMPGGSIYSDYSFQLAADARDEILRNKSGLYFYGDATYDDVFGHHHWSRFCYLLLSGGAYSYCRKNNELDTN